MRSLVPTLTLALMLTLCLPLALEAQTVSYKEGDV